MKPCRPNLAHSSLVQGSPRRGGVQIYRFSVMKINHVHAFCPMHFAFFEEYCYRYKFKVKQSMSSRQNKFAEL